MRYTKIFPNIFQIAFLENLYKNKTNELFQKRIESVKERANIFFENYEKKIQETIKVNYEYQNRLFMTKEAKIVIQTIQDGKKVMYPMNSLKKVVEFLTKNGITEFPFEVFVFDNNGKAKFTGKTTSLAISKSKNIEFNVLDAIFNKKDAKLYADTEPKIQRYNLLLQEIYKNIEERENYTLYTGEIIKKARIIHFKDFEVILKVNFTGTDIVSVIPREEGDIVLPKNTFIKSIGLENVDIDFDQNPLIKQLSRQEQFINRIDKKLSNNTKKAITNRTKLIKEIEKLKEEKKKIDTQRVEKLRKIEKEANTGLINQITKASSVIQKLGDTNGDYYKKLKEKTLEGEESNKLSNFLKAVNLNYTNTLITDIKFININQKTEVIKEAIQSLSAGVETILDKISKTTGDLYNIRNTLFGEIKLEAELDELLNLSKLLLEIIDEYDPKLN